MEKFTKQKIRVTTAYFSNKPGAIGHAMQLYWLNEINREYELHIITNQIDFLKENYPFEHLYEAGCGSTPYLRSLIFWIKSIIRLRKINYDLLFLFHDSSILSFFNRKPYISYVVQSHEIIGLIKHTGVIGLLQKGYHHMITKGILRADFVFAYSRGIQSLLTCRGINPGKTGLLVESLNSDLFSRSKYGSSIKPEFYTGDFILVYTGAVFENRGLNIMLQGIKESAKDHPGIQLIIIGAYGAEYKLINQFSEANKIQSNIINVGIVDYKQIPYYIYYSDLCLSLLEYIPSYSISPPQKIFEYMAMGKPVLANNIPTHTDYLKDGINGKIIDYTVPDFVKGVNWFYTHREESRLMALANEVKLNNSENGQLQNVLFGKIRELTKTGIGEN